MQTYTIDNAIQEVAEALQHFSDHSKTTIRCALNDALDAASKSGFEVADDDTGFGYDQPAAVAEVRRMIGEGIC
jgi:isocitrate lyase